MLLLLISLSFIYATTTPPTHKELDDEMRGYVKYAVQKLGYEPDSYASHVTPTLSWASVNYFTNGWSAYYIINFDREFVERQPARIKKAIAAHEVGHTYYPCAVISQRYRFGLATYLESENCADVISAIVYKYEWTLEALRGIKKELPEAESIDERIALLIMQLGDAPPVKNEEERLTEDCE